MTGNKCSIDRCSHPTEMRGLCAKHNRLHAGGTSKELRPPPTGGLSNQESVSRTVPAFDLTQPEMAYLFAFLQMDGTYWLGTRNRGRISVELSVADVAILQRFQELVPFNSSITFRTRRTNFAEEHASATWTLCSLAARQELEDLGLPPGKKSTTIAPPNGPISERDYLRGLVDADGSVGFTARGYPFISFTTKSSLMNAYFCAKVLKVTGERRTVNPNKRDGVYNLLLTSEPAVEFARWLYYEGCLALERKRVKAEKVSLWVRPEGMRSRTKRKRWRPEEDAVVLSTTTAEAAYLLGRTEMSVSSRRWRLRNQEV